MTGETDDLALESIASVGSDLPVVTSRGAATRNLLVPARGPFSTASGLESGDAEQLLREATPAPVPITVLARGERRVVSLPAGERLGVDASLTSYPLILCPDNDLGTERTISRDPGTYLLLVRAPGRESVRVTVTIDRLRETTLQLDLPELGSVPPGFVFVPGGRLITGGDPLAMNPPDPEPKLVRGFCMARHELTMAEYYRFLRDPRIDAEIRTSLRNGRAILLPRAGNRDVSASSKSPTRPRIPSHAS